MFQKYGFGILKIRTFSYGENLISLKCRWSELLVTNGENNNNKLSCKIVSLLSRLSCCNVPVRAESCCDVSMRAMYNVFHADCIDASNV